MFINYLTAFNLKNIIQTELAFVLGRILHRPLKMGLPIALSVEPASFCNLHCPECPSGNGSLTRARELISIELYEKIINEIAPHTVYLTLYFQGEPYLHPDFTTLINIAHQKNIYTASSTNAHFLSDENAEKTVRSGLDKLIVSVDGTTQAVYEKYRTGGNLQEVCEGIKRLVACKKRLKSRTPFVEMQFLVFKHNEHQVSEIRKMAKELGVNKLSLKTAQIYDFENGSPLLPARQKYSRYKEMGKGKFILRKPLCNRCRRAFTGAVITADGTVLPCAFDKNGEHAFGNICEQSFAKIWQGEKALRFRAQILQNRKAIEICRNCV
ncbi:MAG: radical SAM protein [Prevotellaceae bacterium]|jgi:radical SAM protein with 4Fe4S-binding SPASM domain|nr:radical SAM protein [Prevotellaceae bacterium]